ncbi:glycosyltransferase involved in cell wall biosynthesis [Salinibacter ruber]|uniref:Glycosyltransferase involved in cell wall biosynthesis n=1 Tax=Salinibacter ruber TaxID=146919 RepID=A0A9X2PZU1_9BACT|nr:glycosyltransferase [Salinibacter ruber]MCS3677799.1 glycosyltransferase involved in cell wall biosynthesis [Salinibacter ruber]MCS3681087.1 glycosyltransferase involved in cell wall biosynthesis [Salinibacter ruber]
MGLKIGLYIPTLNGGGAQRVALNLAKGFVGHDCDVNLILVKQKGELKDDIPVGVDVVNLNANRSLTSIPKLALHFRKEKYDLVISFMNYVNICAIAASVISLTSHKVIVTEHTTVSRSLKAMKKIKGWRRSKLIQYLYPIADHVTAVSEGAAEDLKRVGNLQNVHAIPNPISVEGARRGIQEGKAAHPWFEEDDPVVMGAGRLAEVKGFSTLIRSLRHVRDRGVNARLVIIGEGEERENLERLIRDLGLEKCVRLPGFVNNPSTYMRAADVFVLSSRWEGFGNVLVEAMACGTPVVSTNCPNGPAEILENGKWGHLVPVGDQKALAEAIIDVFESRRAHPVQHIKRAGDFSTRKIAKQYLGLLENNSL